MHVAHFFAYLDPGTGSLIIQSLIGAAAGIAVFGRRTLIGIKQKLRGRKDVPAETAKTPATKADDSKK